MQRSPENHRDRQVGEQGHLRRHHRHADAHHQHGGDQLQDLVGTPIQKPFELVDVVVEHRHQATGAVLLEKGQLQLLQMVVGLKPEAVLGCLRQVAPEHVVEVLEQRLRRPDHKGEQGQAPQLLASSPQTEAPQHGLLTAQDHIQGQADQGRWREIEQLVEQRARHRCHHQATLRREMAQQPHQRGASC